MRSDRRELPENLTGRRRTSRPAPEETDMGFLRMPVSIHGWCLS